MARFHTLIVTDVQKTTRDAVVVSLRPETPEAFAFTQGQYLTFRQDFDGEELRRSYSICSGVGDDTLQVGIKRVEGGAFSTWANETLAIGDTLEAMPPMGRFHTDLNDSASKHYLGFAAGSGITPILSIMRTVMAREPASRFTLVYANRSINSIMFRDALEDLKNEHLGRISIVHILKQDAQGIDLFTGRIDAEKCAQLFRLWINIKDIDTSFICGPEAMMHTISGALKEHGMRDDQIKFELFASAQPGRAARKSVAATDTNATTRTAIELTLDGETRNFEMPKDMTLLEAAIDNNIDAPFSCKAGVCSTCRAKVTQGEVEMVANHSLEDGEVARGFVLTCQCYPLTDTVVFDYDQH